MMMEIIPAIDLIDGRCVRLVQGDFAQQTIYGDDPLETARNFEAAGLTRLHVVDLDGARRGRPANLKALERIAAGTRLTIDFGGGLKTPDDLAAVFDAGAAIAGVGSVAVREPERFFEFVDTYGSEKILLGADARGRKLAIDGWQTATEIELLSFLKEYSARGVTQAFVTDISKDGLLKGPAVELYAEILRTVPTLKLIASGGVSKIEDVRALETLGCAGVIVGKAIYEGNIKLEELKGEMERGRTRI